MRSLKAKTVSGVKWDVLSKVAQKACSVASFAILARILEPSSFGLFAMAFVLIDGLGLFRALGIDSAIIQKKNLPEKAIHTAFFMIQTTGIVMFGICYLVAPLAAWFFKNSEVTSVIQALGVLFVISCFGRVSRALLVKEMRFRLISTIEIIGTVVNAVLAVAFTCLSRSVWSLVGAYLVKQVVMSTLQWWYSGYRVKWQFDLTLAKELFDFGKFLVGISFIWFFGSSLSTALVGRELGATKLGYYVLACNLTYFINSHFTQIVSDVMFPAYSKLQGDSEAMKRAYLKTVKYVSVFTIPFSVALMTLAKEFTLFFYGGKWIATIPLIQVAAVSQFMVPIVICASSIFTACGNPHYSYRLALLDLVLKIPTFYILIKLWGLMGAIVAGLVVLIVYLPVYFYLLKKIVSFKLTELVQQLLPSTYCSLVMWASILGLKMLLHAYPLLSYSASRVLPLIIFGFTGLGVYLFTFNFVDRASSVEIKRMIFKLEST